MTSLELWLGMEGTHVTFLEVWLRIASFELWLGMKDDTTPFFALTNN